MTQQTKTLLLSFLFLLSSSPLILSNNASISIYGGYMYMMEKGKGLTSQQNKNDIRSGLSWEATLSYTPLLGSENKWSTGIGLLYSGYNSGEASLPHSSDNLYLHYLAPQLILLYSPSDKMLLKGLAGLGRDWYVNQSEVYSKSRYVTGRAWGVNCGLEASYFLSSHLAVSLKASYIMSELRKFKSDYHGESITVKFEDGINLGRIGIMGGLSYYF